MPPYLAQFPMMITLKVALDAAVPVFSSVSVSRPEIRVDRHGTAASRAVEGDVPPFTGIFIINSNVALVDHEETQVFPWVFVKIQSWTEQGQELRLSVSTQSPSTGGKWSSSDGKQFQEKYNVPWGGRCPSPAFHTHCFQFLAGIAQDPSGRLVRVFQGCLGHRFLRDSPRGPADWSFSWTSFRLWRLYRRS